jgi:hypothetical protein
METSRQKLNNLFNNLSSIYSKDNGMLNSNLYVLFNAYAEVFQDVQRNINQTQNNTYIFSADSDALEDNFGSLINFPKPPRLNTVDNGDNIYRFILGTLYQYFLSGATVATMEASLNEVLSLLTIDPSTQGCSSVVNYSYLPFDATSVQVTWPAVQCVSGVTAGIAGAGDILIDPSDLIVTSYDDSTRTVSFTGTVNTGTRYQFIYNRDNTNYIDTNWMNLTNRTVQNVSPMNLSSGLVNTYNNPEFSYWWNNYNADGEGVVVNEFEIDESDSSLVWRLPQRTVRFLNPYTNTFTLKSYDFYNLTGTSYVLQGPITPTNPDTPFSDLPINYQDEVSGKYQNYFIRYNQNNPGPAPVNTQFSGVFPKYTKKFGSIEFPSDDFGPLDFFEKNANFDQNDLFGSGTKHAWTNVTNNNGKYIIDNSSFVQRDFSLHQNILTSENFESNSLSKLTSNFSEGTRITESPGNQKGGKQNCLMLISSGTGSTTSVSPVIPNADLLYAPSGINHINVDFYDANYTGTSTYIDIIRTGTSNSFHQFRFGIDKNLFTYLYPTGLAINVSGVEAISSGTGFTLASGSDIFNNSKPYGFVETYFSSSGSTNYATNQVGPYVLSSGNPYSNYSDMAMVPSGSSTILVPNIDNASIQDMDSFTAAFDFNPTGNYVKFGFSFYHSIGDVNVTNSAPYLTYIPTPFMPDSASTKIGGPVTYFNSTLPLPHTGNIVQVPFFAQRDFSFFTNPGNNRLYLQFTDHEVISGSLAPISATYDTGVDLAGGLNTFEIVKNQYLKINGVTYVFAKNIVSLWETPGNYQSYFNNVDIGSDRSFSIEFSSGISIYHAYFGNQSKKNSYLNELSNAFTNTLNNTEANLVPVPIPYFYQISTVPGTIDSQPKTYLDDLGRQKKWHRLTVDFGTDFSGLAALVDETTFYSGSIGFAGYLNNPSGIILSSTSQNPASEFGFFDNIEMSYFDYSMTLEKYQIQLQSDTWEGSMLEQSSIVDNKFFKLEPVANFQFLVTIKGLDENYIYIVNDIIQRVKPAYALAIPVYLLEQSLDTTSQVPEADDDSTNWETGNIDNNIIILPGSTSGTSADLPGFIGISGMSV